MSQWGRDIGDGTIGGLLRSRTTASPDSPLVFWENTTFTYQEIDEAADRFAGGLLRAGLQPSDRVALLLTNRPEFLICWFGIARAGMIQVPINTAYKGTFLHYILEHSESSALITEPLFASALTEDVCPDTLESIIFLDSVPHDPSLKTATAVFSEYQETYTDVLPPVSCYEASAILYTSGTTGLSKGVVTPHLHNIVMGKEAALAMRVTPVDRLYTCLPLFHGNAQLATCINAVYAGASVVLSRRFSASQFWNEVAARGATEFNAIGSMLYMLLKQPSSPLDRQHQVSRAFVAPAPGDVLYRFEHRFGVHLIEGYGQTEIKNVAYNPWHSRRVGSFGLPTPSSILEIHDPSGRNLPPGEAGEIVYRPREPGIICLEYFRNPEATVSSSRDLWWHTGDLGFRDRDGYFYFVDRQKDALRRRGENISSQEVEAATLGHPSVKDAAAVGVQSDVGEDEVLIVLEIATEGAADLVGLFSYCEAHLPYFMVPRYYRVVDALPRTSNGKVQKSVLRQDGVTPDTWDSLEHGLLPKRSF